MAIGFVIFWLALGLGVFLIALRGGPRAARESLHAESRAGQRLALVIAVAAAAFGIAVPTLVLAYNGEHKASVAPGGVTLTAAQQHGRYLFGQVCASCHTLAAARADARVGPNLDIERPPYALVLDAIATGRARGMGQMPAMLYQGRDARDVASFVAATVGQGQGP